MELALESTLAQRAALLDSGVHRRRSVVLSMALHLVLVFLVLVVPMLLTREPEPIEFTPITIVPVQALGVPEPAPPSRSREARPEPKPEPAQPKPEPQAETPKLPPPDKKPTTKPAAERQADVAATPPTEQTSSPDTLGQRQGSPLGSSLGTSAFGATVGGLDNPDFVYGYYVDQMLAMIGANWQRPPLGAEVQAVIHFRIHRDGRISDVRVIRSSGYNSYDLAGLRAIQLAAPLPRLPQSFKHDSLGVNLILR